MKITLAKSLVATAVLALTAGAAQAAAPVGAVTVTINEKSLEGFGITGLQANQLNGQFDEVFTGTATSATTGTFVTEATFAATSWLLNGTPTSGAALNTTYGMYANFASSGTYTVTSFTIPDGSGGTTTASLTVFTTNSASLSLYADLNQDTKYNVKTSATGQISNLTLTSGAASINDDVLLGTSTVLLNGTGNATAGGLGNANGNFELLFSAFNLATGGNSYFTAPRPFNLQLDLNGNFQSFIPTTTVGNSSSIQLLANSANAFFLPNAVPEPGALALAGIALVGAAVATRRKSKV